MRLYDKDALATVGEEDQLVLHLSEPRFTWKQRIVRRIRQFIAYCREFL